MHASSMENMRKCRDRYLRRDVLATKPGLRVLDVGGADVNGNYRKVFEAPGVEYLTADIDAGHDVDIVMRDPYVIPLDDASIDVVISGQMLEHCEFFWLAFAEMLRVLQPDGLLFLIAPSAGPIHRYPVDCYRFYPDAYHALARHAGCRLIDVWMDERGPWRDLVGVFAKREVPRFAAGEASGTEAPDPFSDTPGTEEEEVIAGSENYLDFLARLHRCLQPELYLEIGVRRGASLALAGCRAVAVDPFPDIEGRALPPGTRVVTATSDDFFEFDAATALPAPIDLAFIDGMHLFEYALRDFMNIERRSDGAALVLVDDIFPSHPAQAERVRRTRVWMGDVWKLQACLREHRPDLFVLAVDTRPSGMMLIAGLDPSNRTLWDGYNPIVRRFAAEVSMPPEVMARRGAWRPDDVRLAEICALLRETRGSRIPPQVLVARLRGIGADSGKAR